MLDHLLRSFRNELLFFVFCSVRLGFAAAFSGVPKSQRETGRVDFLTWEWGFVSEGGGGGGGEGSGGEGGRGG